MAYKTNEEIVSYNAFLSLRTNDKNTTEHVFLENLLIKEIKILNLDRQRHFFCEKCSTWVAPRWRDLWSEEGTFGSGWLWPLFVDDNWCACDSGCRGQCDQYNFTAWSIVKPFKCVDRESTWVGLD